MFNLTGYKFSQLSCENLQPFRLNNKKWTYLVRLCLSSAEAVILVGNVSMEDDKDSENTKF